MSTLPYHDQVVSFGRTIFSAIGKEQPSTLNKNFWISKVMQWSMTKQEFKTNLFRLVDVLPSLKTSDSIARHVHEYLGDVAGDLIPSLGPVLRWGARVPERSLRAKLTAFAVQRGVKEVASLFIAGEDPHSALKKIRGLRKNRLAFTLDLLGEFCVSEKEAKVYSDRYMEALSVLGKEIFTWPEAAPLIPGNPGETSPLCVSVKLTALYSQCSPLNYKRTVEVLTERLSEIVTKAKETKALVYVDAEDSASNPMIYEAFKRVFSSPSLKDLPYPGIVIQAYAKEAKETVQSFIDFAKKRGAPIAVRLVKGAYWDFETVLSEQMGLPSPLFSKKESSDACFEELSRLLLDNHQHVLPAFASHNIRSLSHACVYAETKGLTPAHFELQMLYGMAEPIALTFSKKGYLVRLYVPLGDMFVGMGYLVRRLLENTSNESFLRHTFFDEAEVEYLLKEPSYQG